MDPLFYVVIVAGASIWCDYMIWSHFQAIYEAQFKQTSKLIQLMTPLDEEE